MYILTYKDFHTEAYDDETFSVEHDVFKLYETVEQLKNGILELQSYSYKKPYRAFKAEELYTKVEKVVTLE